MFFRRRTSVALEELEQRLNATSSPLNSACIMKEQARQPSMSIPPFVIKATAIASIGGILFGYDLGVISGALPLLKEEFQLSERQQECVVGILYLGAGLGACFGGSICDRLGRKTGILITDGIFLIGAMVLFGANTVALLYLARVILGFGVSVSVIAGVAYLHEIAPAAWRGSIVSVNEGCISLGFLLAFFSGEVFRESANGWRYMFCPVGVLACLQIWGMWSMPESPVWLQQQGKVVDQQAALRTIYGGDEQIPTNDPECTQEAQDIPRHSSGQLPRIQSYVDTLATPEPSLPQQPKRLLQPWQILVRYRMQMIVAAFLAISQQLSGQTAVLNYAPLIFKALDDDNTMSMIYVGIVKLVVTILVIWRIEYLGRRFLLMAGMGVLVLGQFILAVAFRLVGVPSVDGEAPSSGVGWALPGVLCVVVGYSASFGPLTWLLTSEMFPAQCRGRALGTSTVLNYLMAALTTSTFLSIQALLGSSIVFCVYGAVTAIGIGFVYLAIPDTGGKSVQEIDRAFREMWWWRTRRALDTISESEMTRGSVCEDGELT